MSRNQSNVALMVGLGMVLIAALAAALVFWSRRSAVRQQLQHAADE
jgi:hypothetical protein